MLVNQYTMDHRYGPGYAKFVSYVKQVGFFLGGPKQCIFSLTFICSVLYIPVFYDLPVLVIAILTESRYFFILAVIGFASTTSTIIWDLSHPPTAYIFLCANFCILAVLFVCIYRSRGSLHNRFVRWLSACARHTCAIEALEDDTLDNDEVNTTGLLTNEAAEEA